MISNGVRQDVILSPLLLNLFTNDINVLLSTIAAGSSEISTCMQMI